jgi:hypothetical protein
MSNQRRGMWIPETFNKAAAIKTSRHGAKPVNVSGNNLSNSENYVNSRNRNLNETVPLVVSDHRKESLTRGTSSSNQNSENISPLIVYSSSYKQSQEFRKNAGLNKTATSSTTNQNFGFGGSSGTVRQAPEIYSPLFQIANLQLPRDRITMNAWNRNFYDTHPLVHNCINLHATYPISKINIKCKDQKVQRFFEEMSEEMDLIGTLQNIALEFWKIGECFPYAELDENRGTWRRITIQNPDYIHVKTSVLSGESTISLRPDAALMRLVQSNNPADVQLKQNISEEILYHVKKGNNIPLDNFHISHLKMLSSPYDIHGTSVIVSIYKDLMLYDKLRESKFAQADNLVNPITLVKVGGTGEGEFHPTPQALEQYRQIFEAAQYDKDFKIITHAGVSVERVGASGQIIDISGDMNFIVDNILFGLMTPKAILTQDGASFNSASIGLEVLKQRYEAFRNMMARWLTKKIFAPISEIQEFYEYEDGNKKLIVPEIDWNQMILYDMDNYINVLNQLATQNPQSPTISKATLFRSLGLNIDEERRRIKEEMINNIISTKEQQLLQTMSLGALRSVKPDDDIIEPTESTPLPGTPGSEESGTPTGGLGGPDLGLGGGAPELSSLLPPPTPPPTPPAPKPATPPAPKAP